MYCVIYNCRSKLHGSNSIKDNEGKTEVYHCTVLALYTKRYDILEGKLRKVKDYYHIP